MWCGAIEREKSQQAENDQVKKERTQRRERKSEQAENERTKKGEDELFREFKISYF